MSSRIEKGGTKFKPTPNARSRPGASSASASLPASSASASLPASSAPLPGSKAGASNVNVPPSPNLTAQPSALLAKPPDVSPSAPVRSTQSFAFNAGQKTQPPTTADNANTFRRPAIVKPRPGSRASLTPAPQYQQPHTRASQPPPPNFQAVQKPPDATTASIPDSSIDPGLPVAQRTKLAPAVNATREESRETPSSYAGPSVSAAYIKQSLSQPQASTSALAQSSSDAVYDPQLLHATPSTKPTKAVSNGSDADDDDAAADGNSSQARRSRADAAARRAKRRLKRKEAATGKPKRPASAYILFVNAVRANRQAQNPGLSLTQLTTTIAAEWRQLSMEEKRKWDDQATVCRHQYDHDLQAWYRKYPDGVTVGTDDDSDLETTSELDEQGEPIRRRKKRKTSTRKTRTVSDDEAEYQMQVHVQGPTLTASRLDPSSMTMGEISTVLFRQGRAGPRTFETDRVYKRMVDDRKTAAREALLGDHVLSTKADTSTATPQLTVRSNTTRGPDGEIVTHSDDEQVVDASEVEESAPETETETEGGQSSRQLRRRKREVSVAATDVSFRENRFAVQTRIVDGRIVLDETSLYANFDNGEEDRDNMEVVDEREGDRFVNSSTYSRKLGRNRKWGAEETAHFFRAMQQWGTDFEMIARLFPGRDRVMIKKKYNAEERANPKLIDQALRNTLPVSLEAYSEAIGVDLSGPLPEIKADIHDIQTLNLPDTKVKKRENTAPLDTNADAAAKAQTDDEEYEEVVEIDDDGNETVVRRPVGRRQTRSKSKRKA